MLQLSVLKSAWIMAHARMASLMRVHGISIVPPRANHPYGDG